VEGIAQEVETKTFDEVSAYMEVFLQRFRELKERDLVIMKFEKKTFEQKNLETIRDFDRNQNYYCMVQVNQFFSTEAYLALMARA